MPWIMWLVPVGLFWPTAAIWLGGLREPTGGTAGRQLLGLGASFVVFLVVWWGLGRLFATVGGSVFGGVILPTLLALAGMPFLLTAGYRLVGLRLRSAVPAH